MARSTAAVPTRPFGRTGIPVSILALGGWHLGLPKTERESTRLVHAAIDGGITFMDNAWDYNEGVSETRMGKALIGRRELHAFRWPGQGAPSLDRLVGKLEPMRMRDAVLNYAQLETSTFLVARKPPL